MVARSYILDTKSFRRNSPLALAALLTSLVKKYLQDIERDDLAQAISTVTFFRNIVTIVTGKPVINFELRTYEGMLLDIISKSLVQHGFESQIELHFR